MFTKPKLTTAQFITMRGLALTFKMTPEQLGQALVDYNNVEVDQAVIEEAKRRNREAPTLFRPGEPCPYHTKALGYKPCGSKYKHEVVREKDGAHVHHFECAHTVVQHKWRRADEEETLYLKSETLPYTPQDDGSFVATLNGKPAVRIKNGVYYITNDL